MKKRVLLLLVAVLLIACTAFAVSASGETTPATIDLANFKCPCSSCNGNPYTGIWITYDDIIAGTSVINPSDGAHYYINKTLTPGEQISVSAGEEVVYVLDNANIVIGGGTDGITARGLLVKDSGTVMHLIGNNAVYAAKTSTTYNGIVQISGGAVLNLYGDLTMQRNSVGTNASTNSGLFRMASGTLHIHDCDGMNLPTNDDPVLHAPQLADNTASLGGIFNMEGDTCYFIMDAGTLNGTTKAYAGGAISAPFGTVTINGGTINASTTEGAVVNGGAIYVNGGTVHINGGTINGGAATHGGAIYVKSGTLTIGNDANVTTGATVNGGTVNTSSGLGGAICMAGGSVTMGAKATIAGGTAWRGGCVYVKGTFNMNGGSISGGKSTNQGGQVFVAGTFNMTSGTVTANSKSTSNAPGFRIQDGKLHMSGDAVVVSSGTGTDDAIDVVTVSTQAEVTLAGAATVKNASGNTNGNNIINLQNYGNNTAKLTVQEGWTGTAYVNYEYLFGTKLKEEDYTVGMTIAADAGASTGEYTGNLYMFNAPNLPPLYAGTNGTLQVAYIQLCTYNLPKLDAEWFKDATTAAAAAKPGDYIGVFTSCTMDIGSKDVLVDFNGNDCTVTGTGKLYIMDAAGDDYEGTLAKVTYDNVAATSINPANDYQYVALPNGDGTWSAHRVDLRFTAVSVRPNCAGVYYTADLDCDETLMAAFEASGVAVSVKEMPGFDYAQKTLYTRATELEEGGVNGVLVTDILKDQADNETRGNYTIYANAYADFTVGDQTVTVLADPYNPGKTKDGFLPSHVYTAHSLYDVMQAMDLRWRTLSDEDKQTVLEKLYNGFDGVMQNWNLRYIDAYVTGEPVKELKVLTIGHSLSVDAGHMLGYIAKQEGMENIHFSTLYYGGCTLRQHATFLTNNTPEYRWYDTNIDDLQNAADADTVPKVSLKKADQVTMYEGIVADDWDIIIMQQGLFESASPDGYGEDMQTVLDYVRKHITNPNAVFIWNMIWAGPVKSEMLDKANNGIAPDAPSFESSYKTITGFEEVRDNKAAQDKLFELIYTVVQEKIETNDNFIDVIPAATGQQNALWSGLSDADMYRDYIHASDLSRYIYSYLWYCKLTDSEFDGVASDTVPLAIRYIKKDDISEIPPATEDLDLTADNNYLLNIVNHCISSALSDPYTPKAMNAQ